MIHLHSFLAKASPKAYPAPQHFTARPRRNILFVVKTSLVHHVKSRLVCSMRLALYLAQLFRVSLDLYRICLYQIFYGKRAKMHTHSPLNVMITGASRGIGLEYVRQYAEAGHQVYATVRHPDEATLLGTLSRQYANVAIHAMDVADLQSIRALASKLKTLKLDILISNAGIYPESSFGQADPNAWLAAFQINTLGTYYLAECLLPQLASAGQAKLIAMTSKMGSIDDNSSGGAYIYRSTKTALNMIIKSLAIDLRQHDITVAALHPGWVRTDMGGPQGLIDTETSVSGLRNVIAQLDVAQSGSFIAYDGQAIPW